MRIAMTSVMKILACVYGLASPLTSAASDDEGSADEKEVVVRVASPWSALMSLTAGQRPEFFEDDGGYMQFDSRLSYRRDGGHTFSLLQGVKTVKRVTSPQRTGTWATDTLLRYSPPTLYQSSDGSLRLLGRLQAMVLPNTQPSRRDTLRGTLAARVTAVAKAADVEVSYGVDVAKREHRYTRNPDGRSNFHTQIMQLASISYSFSQAFALLPYYYHIHRRYHDQSQRDLYWLGVEASYRVSMPLSVHLGLQTTDSLLKSGRRAPVYFYKEDLSEGYLRVDYAI